MASPWHHAGGSFREDEWNSDMQEGWGAMEMAALNRIATLHGLQPPLAWPEPWTGATSRVWPCGHLVIKVALDSPEAHRAVAIDAAMNPVAREIGVHVPALVAFDESGEILPVPYAVYERVPDAQSLDTRRDFSRHQAQAWEDVGRNLALVHEVSYGTSLPVELREFRQHPGVDPRPWVDELAADERLDADDAAWLRHILDALAPRAQAEVPLTLCHGDVNAANVLISCQDASTVWLIDWSGAGWLDPVWDAAAIPLEAVPALLRGHREVAPFPADETAEVRVLWCQLQTRLLNARMEADNSIARARLQRDVNAARRFAASKAWA